MQEFKYTPVKFNDMADAPDEVLYGAVEKNAEHIKKKGGKKHIVILTSLMDTTKKKVDDTLPYDFTSTFAADYVDTINWKAQNLGLPMEARAVLFDFTTERFINWDLPPLVIGEKPEGVDFILDRLYAKNSVKSYVRSCAAAGVQVMNNPFRTNNSKHTDFAIAYERGFPIPVTALELPFSDIPMIIDENNVMKIKMRIVEIARRLGFPEKDLVFKQAEGGGWSHVYFIKKDQFPTVEAAAAYLTEKYIYMRSKLMNLQTIVEPVPENIISRCFKIGDKDWGCSLVYPYNIKNRSYHTWSHLTPDYAARIKEMAFSLSHNVGYDFNTSEWIVDKETGHISAIDFTNETPDMNKNSLGDEVYTRVLHNLVNYSIFRTFNPRPFREYQSLE